MTTTDRNPRDISTLLAIMRDLRNPATGCPWDLAQSFDTIAPYTIEEAYEVADAIARQDLDELRHELGDLLLQVVYHAQMSEELGRFDFADVVEAITTKMVRRHPHVFGSDDERGMPPPKGFWEAEKAKERAKLGTAPKGVLDGVPVALPALTRAIKLQAKAAGVGFDWPSSDEVLTKIAEECRELRDAAHVHDADQHTLEEYGDLLFAMANLARHLGIDPEAALRGANAKFERRFRHIEKELEARGRTPAQSDLAEMDDLWNDAKAKERA
jgi:nucleoside triphosphate diphosphatase